MKRKDQAIATKPAPPTVQRPPQQAPKKPGNQVPVHSPSSGPMQLTPIIQPIAFVPYSTQEQPLYMYDDAQASTYEEDYAYSDDAQEVSQPVSNRAQKTNKVSGAAIALIILSIVMIAVYVIGKFLAMTYVQVANATSGLDMLLNVFAAGAITFDGITVVALGVAVTVVCAVLVLLASLIRIKYQGACGAAKLFSFIGLVTALVAVMISLVQKDEITVNYGLYIIAALALLLVMIAFLSRNRK